MRESERQKDKATWDRRVTQIRKTFKDTLKEMKEEIKKEVKHNE